MKTNFIKKNWVRRLRCLAWTAALVAGAANLGAVTTNWTVVSWNNLGMHCMDSDYSVFSILPPYSTGTVSVVSGNCAFTVAPLSQAFDETGGVGLVSVTLPSCGCNLPGGCSWDVTSGVRWLTLIAGGGTNGAGSVQYRVGRNVGPARTGTLVIAGQTFTVSQGAAAVQRPALASVSGAAHQVGLSGGGGKPNMLYYILSSSDLTSPTANWARVGPNYFDADGQFLFFTPVTGAQQGAFFRVQQP